MKSGNNLVLKIITTIGIAVFGIVDAVVMEKQINKLDGLMKQTKEESH